MDFCVPRPYPYPLHTHTLGVPSLGRRLELTKVAGAHLTKVKITALGTTMATPRYFSRNESFRVQLPRQKPSYRHPRARVHTHAFHGKIQLYYTAVQDSCTVTRHQ